MADNVIGTRETHASPEPPGRPQERSPEAVRPLPSLTSLRCVAAFGVFITHISGFLPIPGTQSVFNLGAICLDYFFVLSGFVLVWTFRPHDTARGFYGRRFARIWPQLFLSTVVATVYFLVAKQYSSVGELLIVSLSALLLIQAWNPNWILGGAVQVTWSLSVEGLFYLLFPFTVRSVLRRTKVQLIVLTVIALALMAADRIYLITAYPLNRELSLHQVQVLEFWNYNPAVHLPEFFIGMITAVAVRRGWRGIPAWAATALTVGAIVVLFLLRNESWRASVVWDPAGAILVPFFALLIVALAHRDLESDRRSLLRSRPVVFLGQASYGFYLFHFIVIFALVSILTHNEPFQDYFFVRPPVPSYANIGWALLALAVATALACVVYRYWEKPLEKRLRLRLSDRSHEIAKRTDPLG
jgi:peptidoglycan/LPS O-acetylase OafA/YrhL